MRFVALLLMLFAVHKTASGQEAVFFFAPDSTKIRADLYLKDNRLPFMILCPDESNTKNQFADIAPRLLNLNYNCLAVDMRTDNPALASGDLKAAMRFVQNYSRQPVILFGSLRSASICLLAAPANTSVRAVIAINPGEYFLPFKQISSTVNDLHQPVLVIASHTDYPYISEMMAGMNRDQLTLFKPEKDNNYRGAAVFGPTNHENNEYWFTLMMFFKKLETGK